MLKGASYGSISVFFLYFILSCAGTVYFLLNLKTFPGKEDAGLPEK